MALIKCENCGTLISENATECPKCGHPLQANGESQHSYTGTPKSKTTTGILALLLGPFGVHYFYLNKMKAGIISLVVSVVLAYFVSWLIPNIFFLVQSIYILTMNEEQFNKKFVYTKNQLPLF